MQDSGWMLPKFGESFGPTCPDSFQAISQVGPSSLSSPSFAESLLRVEIMLLASKGPSRNAKVLAHFKERGNSLWISVFTEDRLQMTWFEEKKEKKKKRKKTWFWITTFKARCVGHKFLTPLALRDGIYSPSSWIWVVCDKSGHHSQKPNLVTWRAHVQKEMSSSPRCPCHSADLGVSHLGIPGLLAILLQQHEQLQTRLAEKKGSHCFTQQSLGMAFYRAKDNWNREVASLKNIFLPLHGHTTEIIKMNCST